MSDKFKTTWFHAALNTYTQKEGLVFKKDVTHYSQSSVDFDKYAASLQEKYEELDAEGYEVINVVPIAMGQSNSYRQGNAFPDAYVGYSITRGAVVVGKKRKCLTNKLE